KLDEILEAGAREHYLDALLYDHEYKRRRHDVRFYRLLGQQFGGPILELGCGTGRLLVPLARDGLEVVGIDHSREMLDRCRERLIYSTTLTWDGPRQLAFMKIYYQPERGGPKKEKSVRLVHRYFFPLELEALLHYNGFRVERVDGGFFGEELATDSDEQVLVC